MFLRVIVMELVVDTCSVPYEPPFISRIHVSPTNDTWILENYKGSKGIREGIMYTWRKKQISKLSIDLTPSRPTDIGVVNVKVHQQGFLNCPHMGRSYPHCLVPWTFWIQMIDYALSGDILYEHNITHQHLWTNDIFMWIVCLILCVVVIPNWL